MRSPRAILAAAAVAVGLPLTLVTPASPAAAADRYEAPRVALGVRLDNGSLRFFDPQTGYTLGGFAGGENIGDIAYSAAVDRGFFVDSARGHPVIREVRNRHGVVREPVAEGTLPSIGGGGRVLAYAFDPDGSGKGSLMQGIAVRDLATGKERRFAGPPVPPGIPEWQDDPTLGGLSVSPDGTKVAYDYFDTGQIHLLDVTFDSTLADSAVILEDPIGETAHYSEPQWMEDGRLAVMEGGDRVLAYDLKHGAFQVLATGVLRYEPADSVVGAALMLSGDPGPVEGPYTYHRMEHAVPAGSIVLPFRAVSW